MGFDSDELHRLYQQAYENKNRLNTKYLKKFEDPFLIKIYDRTIEKGRTIYKERKMYFIGDGINGNQYKGMKELFSEIEFRRISINTTHFEDFPEYKVVVTYICNSFSEIYFFNKIKQ